MLSVVSAIWNVSSALSVKMPPQTRQLPTLPKQLLLPLHGMLNSIARPTSEAYRCQRQSMHTADAPLLGFVHALCDFNFFVFCVLKTDEVITLFTSSQTSSTSPLQFQ